MSLPHMPQAAVVHYILPFQFAVTVVEAQPAAIVAVAAVAAAAVTHLTKRLQLVDSNVQDSQTDPRLLLMFMLIITHPLNCCKQSIVHICSNSSNILAGTSPEAVSSTSNTLNIKRAKVGSQTLLNHASVQLQHPQAPGTCICQQLPTVINRSSIINISLRTVHPENSSDSSATHSLQMQHPLLPFLATLSQ